MSIKNILVHIKTSVLPMPFGLKNCKISGKTITYSNNGNDVKFAFTDRHWMVMTLGSILEIFQNRDYARLNVKGKTVIDVGGYIGDTALFFAIEGANHIYSYEPDADFCSRERANIELNSMSDKITIFQEPADLASILSRIGQSSNLILKMDCEGCEYKQITDSNIELLKRFDEIMLEYHNGYVTLVEVLQKAGFKTWNSEPKKADNMSIGYVYAYR
jgi:hypothetical protein